MKNTPSKQIMTLCLKINDYLKTLQKAFVFDEQDNNSFENTYHQLLNEIIQSNDQIHDIAEKLSYEKFQLDQLAKTSPINYKNANNLTNKP